MLFLVAMSVGVLIGLRLFPAKYKRFNELLQMACTAVLIFCMGLSLGNREGFPQELASLGFQSLVLAVIPIVLSILAVYLLTKKWHTESGEKKQ